jgi:hypothetical protein
VPLRERPAQDFRFFPGRQMDWLHELRPRRAPQGGAHRRTANPHLRLQQHATRGGLGG